MEGWIGTVDKERVAMVLDRACTDEGVGRMVAMWRCSRVNTASNTRS